MQTATIDRPTSAPSTALSESELAEFGSNGRFATDDVESIRESARRVRIAFAAACPEADLLRQLASALIPAPA